ncbi:MAG: DNA topoisomerase I [Candidatus Micrarchaeaceae archaeon]
MNILIIAEKPSVANRIAFSLGKNSAKTITEKSGVRYYILNHGDDTIYVVAAAGHLFTIHQADKVPGYPVLNVEWAPAYTVNASSEYTKAYLDTISMVASQCNIFINACDYDTEGTVIGMNILRFINAKNAESRRMKFSTTTEKDLNDSYANLMPLDIDNFYAGETRHILDWLWGINFSRALSSAFASAGKHFLLSIGRVQGPTLALLSERENEITNFIPQPFWHIYAVIKGVKFFNSRGNITSKDIADKALNVTKESSGVVDKVEKKLESIYPIPPFDLTELQLEASRVFGMDPSRTLALAQSLYERAYISYPRTSSQKLPYSLGLKEIIENLSKNASYKLLAEELIKKNRFKPREGKKEDEAHPAIFPTGIEPKKLAGDEIKLYDLITRRFLACFAEPAEIERTSIQIVFGEEKYSADAAFIQKKGWMLFYPFTKINEKAMPEFTEGENVKASEIKEEKLMTSPPKRYTKASLIAELEKRNLGTKATRAAVIDTLFKREYITGKIITVTKFGLSVYNALKENCNMIIDEVTTRKLEEDMEKISKKEKTEEEVINEGKQMLLEALKIFDKNKQKILEELRAGFEDSIVSFGVCPKDGGKLVMRRSKNGKIFIGCSNYPKCTNTYPLPQNALIKPTNKTCPYCHTMIVKVFRKGKKPYEMDLDPNCISRKNWHIQNSKEQIENTAVLSQESESTTTQKLKEPKKASKKKPVHPKKISNKKKNKNEDKKQNLSDNF